MNGPRWTDRQISFLLKNYGKIPIEKIEKKLKRNKNALRQKWRKLTKYEDKLHVSDVARLFKVDVKTVIDFWIGKKGLPYRRVYREYNIDFGDLLEWLESNQDLWDSKRLDYLGLGYEYDWLVAKRINDKDKVYHHISWTKEDESKLLLFIRSGKSFQFAAEKLNRTESSCRHKYNRLNGRKN